MGIHVNPEWMFMEQYEDKIKSLIDELIDAQNNKVLQVYYANISAAFYSNPCCQAEPFIKFSALSILHFSPIFFVKENTTPKPYDISEYVYQNSKK
jgi:hypothetical protein